MVTSMKIQKFVGRISENVGAEYLEYFVFFRAALHLRLRLGCWVGCESGCWVDGVFLGDVAQLRGSGGKGYR